MSEIIDLSQEIYEGMPVYKDLPQVKMTVHNSHEEWNGIQNPPVKTPAVHKLELGEHTGTLNVLWWCDHDAWRFYVC